MKEMKPNLNGIFLLVIFMIFLIPVLKAQDDGEGIVIGTYYKLDSKILDEERTILIHLPQGYQETDLSYPVVYLLYGDQVTTYFAEAVSILDRLGQTGRVPPMILVSVMNIDRYRDLLPLYPDGSKTGACDFQKFFSEELFPWVENNYRTKDYRILVGPQAGGNFGLHTLASKPDLFDAFILNNPFRWVGGRDLLIKETEWYFVNHQTIRKFICITYDADDDLDKEGIQYLLNFKELVDTTQPADFTLVMDFREDHDEFIQPFGLREGIKKLFIDYPFPEDLVVESMRDIAAYYGRLSAKFGFSIDIPAHVLSVQSDQLVERGKTEEALAIWHYMIDHYPHPGDAYWRLANYHREMGNKKQAIEYFKKLIDLYPDVAMARRYLEELEKEEQK